MLILLCSKQPKRGAASWKSWTWKLLRKVNGCLMCQRVSRCNLWISIPFEHIFSSLIASSRGMLHCLHFMQYYYMLMVGKKRTSILCAKCVPRTKLIPLIGLHQHWESVYVKNPLKYIAGKLLGLERHFLLAAMSNWSGMHWLKIVCLTNSEP